MRNNGHKGESGMSLRAGTSGAPERATVQRPHIPVNKKGIWCIVSAKIADKTDSEPFLLQSSAHNFK